MSTGTLFALPKLPDGLLVTHSITIVTYAIAVAGVIGIVVFVAS